MIQTCDFGTLCWADATAEQVQACQLIWGFIMEAIYQHQSPHFELEYEQKDIALKWQNLDSALQNINEEKWDYRPQRGPYSQGKIDYRPDSISGGFWEGWWSMHQGQAL